MTAAANFPLDLLELQMFRDLRARFGTVEQTLYFIFLLWRDLAQLALAGNACGRLTVDNLASFAALLVDLHLLQDAESARRFLHGECVTVKLFVTDGEDLVCLRFINLNSGLGYSSKKEVIGGRMKSFNHRQRKMESGLMQQLLKVPGHIFVDATTGLELSPEETEAVSRLIMSCDNALLRERPPIGWTEGLVTLALPVMRDLTGEQIEYTIRKIAMQREHPALAGMSTEKLLPQFKTVIGKIEPN
jgi:hypothetical protein